MILNSHNIIDIYCIEYCILFMTHSGMIQDDKNIIPHTYTIVYCNLLMIYYDTLQNDAQY